MAPGGVESTVRRYDGPPVRMQPVLAWHGLPASRSPDGTIFPLDHPRRALTYSGTAAIYQAFRALGLPGSATVLVPSYNCGHEIEPIRRLGLQIQPYRVDASLGIDLDDIERRLDGRVRAILATHYFGFGQDLRELRSLCDRHGLFLVEDCAHAFLSNDARGDLGRLGDAAAYSLRKTLPIPNGGAVAFNNPALSPPADLAAVPGLTTWLKRIDLAKKAALDRLSAHRSVSAVVSAGVLAPFVIGGALVERAHPGRATICYDPDDEDYGFHGDILRWRMSAFSERALGRFDLRAIAKARRDNYRRLAAGLEGIPGCTLLRAEIPDECCPCFLPVMLEQRAEVYEYLLRRRINVALWWNERHPGVEWAQFPEAVALKDRVLALPIHQDLGVAQLDYVIDALQAYPGRR